MAWAIAMGHRELIKSASHLGRESGPMIKSATESYDEWGDKWMEVVGIGDGSLLRMFPRKPTHGTHSSFRALTLRPFRITHCLLLRMMCRCLSIAFQTFESDERWLQFIKLLLCKSFCPSILHHHAIDSDKKRQMRWESVALCWVSISLIPSPLAIIGLVTVFHEICVRPPVLLERVQRYAAWAEEIEAN